MPIHERRRACRIAARTNPGTNGVRIRPGGTVRLIDISAYGALIEGACRVVPGSTIEIWLGHARAASPLLCRVVRSYVARLDGAALIRYRTGLAFHEALDPGVARLFGG